MADSRRPASRADDLGAALATLRTRLDRAVEAAGRVAGEVELLPVTKFFPASDVVALHGLGCEAFGESREQEASRKIAEVADELPDAALRWHMVGRIQRNKAKAVAAWAHTAHSVDGIALIQALGRGAVAALEGGGRSAPLRVFVQLSLDGDPERSGVDVREPALVDDVCAAAAGTDGLELAGLMAIPPLGADADEAFARLAAERDRLQVGSARRLGLSAGMSGDLEAAVRHGSTCVRVGTALMGPRPLTSP
ncbi:YggS family pyridoxal phosphate-dependent enzyme [Mycolicibacterium grossiae]|uniref:Pyridoxal phosphate homeostasis protein n=1 Tax=Mycolicibacterium grossiae TaxID=1552759 RepID=A0A1E8PZN8_9MYCO|nr:YggS family pyridoxal phosphate-dependent enzyme [Mycolicibacterium grossiae]OFJ51259.1 YggS family pyridoxal phosphate enzyme [Mycolicibacterium grossiae]QEM47094.1 YggS family pyridoxal phosphate-dependent enzyme [Mycolicibacterium grossiae]